MGGRFLFFVSVFISIIFITPQAFARHQDEASSKDSMVEVIDDPSTGQQIVKPAPDPILQTQPEGVEGKKLETTTDDRVKEHEEKMKAFQAATVTREEVTGHIFNYFKGFEFRFGITGVLQNSFRNDGNSPQGDQLDGSGSLDLVIARQFFDHGLGLVHLEAGVGNGLNQIPVFNALLFGQVDREAVPQARRVEVAEAYYEGNYLGGAFVFTIGLLDPTVYFDNNNFANDETTQFLNAGFRNNTVFEMPGSAFGAQITGLPVDWFYVKGGLFDASSTGYDLEDNVFWAVEVGFMPKFGELEGHYRIYGWQNRGAHVNLNNGRTNDYGMGIGVSIDQLVTKWFALFARGGYQSPSIYPTKMAFSGGIALLGNLYGREHDRLGIGYGVAINNDKFARGRNEQVIEAFYRLSVAKGHVGISPDVQFIIHPSGAYNVKNVIVAGLRAQVDF